MEENKKFLLILTICWFIPLFGPLILFAIKPKSLSYKSHFVVCELLNKHFTMTLLYYIYTIGFLRLLYTNNQARVILAIVVFIVIYIFSLFMQYKYTKKWLENDLKPFPYILKIFKQN